MADARHTGQRQLRLRGAEKRPPGRLPTLWLRAITVRQALFNLRRGAERHDAANYNDLKLGSGGLYRLAFGRPSLCGSLDDLRQAGSDPTLEAFNKGVLCSPLSAAGGYPENEGFGDLGRNVLRGLWQRRIDLSLAKVFGVGARSSVELRWDVFNLLNNVNFGLPNNVIGDASTDFGMIADTVGGPRVMQFGAKLRF
ncbi:hypothetical protein LuPra_04040 [Luteitalea pratensis]|uniref:TonB-dependent transporter Oar-like beta-barrel domain-containing protein n=1 Tax=Luteitalea pratensis TaxID=1855912 RepID=A0A143PSI6_LUTPR|nr:hypothetical protein [Luteitalea pratensis]AMY10799.1 hypothetical protein LuPra_04040 [Luteitalea pratensis]